MTSKGYWAILVVTKKRKQSMKLTKTQQQIITCLTADPTDKTLFQENYFLANKGLSRENNNTVLITGKRNLKAAIKMEEMGFITLENFVSGTGNSHIYASVAKLDIMPLTIKELRQEFKKLKENGSNVRVSLNSDWYTLWVEWRVKILLDRKIQKRKDWENADYI